MSSPSRDTVFISYSHANPTWLDRFATFLKPFVRKGELTLWHDQYIKVGDVWRRKIGGALGRASVGLLLVSQDFIASDFIMGEGVPALVKAANDDLLTLFPVPVSSCTHGALDAADTTPAPTRRTSPAPRKSGSE
jgi:hypothetical protein